MPHNHEDLMTQFTNMLPPDPNGFLRTVWPYLPPQWRALFRALLSQPGQVAPNAETAKLEPVPDPKGGLPLGRRQGSEALATQPSEVVPRGQATAPGSEYLGQSASRILRGANGAVVYDPTVGTVFPQGRVAPGGWQPGQSFRFAGQTITDPKFSGPPTGKPATPGSPLYEGDLGPADQGFGVADTEKNRALAKQIPVFNREGKVVGTRPSIDPEGKEVDFYELPEDLSKNANPVARYKQGGKTVK